MNNLQLIINDKFYIWSKNLYIQVKNIYSYNSIFLKISFDLKRLYIYVCFNQDYHRIKLYLCSWICFWKS